MSIKGEVLYGIHPVSMTLKAGRRNVHAVYYNHKSKRAVEVANQAEEMGKCICVRVGTQAIGTVDYLLRRIRVTAVTDQFICALKEF